MKHVSVWPAYVLHVTLQNNTHKHTRTKDSELQTDLRHNSDQSFPLPPWLLRLHEKLCQKRPLEKLFFLLFLFSSSQAFFFCQRCSIFPYLCLIICYKHSRQNAQALPTVQVLMIMLHDSLIQEVSFLLHACMINEQLKVMSNFILHQTCQNVTLTKTFLAQF